MIIKRHELGIDFGKSIEDNILNYDQLVWDKNSLLFINKNISENIAFGVKKSSDWSQLIYSRDRVDGDLTIETPIWGYSYGSIRTSYINKDFYICSSPESLLLVHDYSPEYENTIYPAIEGIFADPKHKNSFFMFSLRADNNGTNSKNQQGKLYWYNGETDKRIETHGIYTSVEQYTTKGDEYILGSIYLYHPVDKNYVKIPYVFSSSRTGGGTYQLFQNTLMIKSSFVGFAESRGMGRGQLIITDKEGEHIVI